MKAVRITNVNYLNAIPFRFGLEHYPFSFPIELHQHIPAYCAQELEEEKTDISLIPVGSLPQLKHHHIISDYCIGAEKEVLSVGLYSNTPIEQTTSIYMDPHSRTSVKLAQILAKEKWGIQVKWERGKENFEHHIPNHCGAIIIGDKTFNIEHLFQYKYDLATEWNILTGLPFVFACWVSTKPIPAPFIEELNKAFYFGIQHTEEAIRSYLPTYPFITQQKATEYLSRYISYELNTDKKKALQLYLSKI